MNTKDLHLRLRRLCAALVGIVFILAGVSKLLDPVGAALVMEEYFKFFHLGGLLPIAKPVAVALALAEAILGAALVSGVFRKAMACAVSAMLVFFTVLTSFLAIFDPPMDCGCFGEAIHLTNLQTFLKNLVLLTLAVVAFVPSRDFGKAGKRKYFSFAIVSAGLVAFMVYSLVSLPLVDFTAFSPGSELQAPDEGPQAEGAGDYVSTFIYEKDGQEGVFTLDRLPDSTWTYVRTETILRNGPDVKESNPVLSFTDQDGTYQDHKASEGDVLVVSVPDPSKLKGDAWFRISVALEGARAAGFEPLLLVTSSPEAFGSLSAIVPEVRGLLVPSLHFADARTLLALNRSNGGATWFNDGQLIRKFHLKSLPSEEELTRMTGLDPVEAMLDFSIKGRLAFQASLLYIFAILLFV